MVNIYIGKGTALNASKLFSTMNLLEKISVADSYRNFYSYLEMLPHSP
jgi:hypothetical protein